MTAPRSGPLIRAHSIGGPACRTGRGVMPGTTSMAGPHVDQHRLGGEEALERPAVGGVDVVPPERLELRAEPRRRRHVHAR